ncbi:MAG: hypothetical protein O2954_08190 [bacterium]|nr:hypothetical protein [bacterium]
MNLPWNLTFEDVAGLVGLDTDARITVVEPSRPFGGYTGEKALLKVEVGNKVSQYVLLKRTQAAWAEREMQAYRALNLAGAPVVTYYGLHVPGDGQAVIAVEYLQYAIDWPISPGLHLAWAAAAAALARSPIPEAAELLHVWFLPEQDTILAGLEEVAGDSDPALRVALAEVNTERVLARARETLASFLAQVDALPRGLTHGECYPMHMGRRTPDGPVVFFDITSAGIRPRFFDVQGLIVDHGEPYEIGDVTPVLERFWKEYDSSIPWDMFRWEVALVEGLVALRSIGTQMRFLRAGQGEAWQNTEEIRRGHFKWLRLSLARAEEVLTAWERGGLG